MGERRATPPRPRSAGSCRVAQELEALPVQPLGLVHHDQHRLDVEAGPQQPGQALALGAAGLEVEQPGAQLLGHSPHGRAGGEGQEHRLLAGSGHRVLHGEGLARPGLAMDDAHRSRFDHIGHGPLAQRIGLGSHHAGVEVQEVPAHQSVANPSRETERGPAWGPQDAASASVTTEVGSASADAVAGESR